MVDRVALTLETRFLVNVHEVDAAHSSDFILSQKRLAEQSFRQDINYSTETV